MAGLMGSDKLQAEESETYVRMLLESAPDAMIIVDDEGKMTIVNAQAEAMFGYDRDEMHALLLLARDFGGFGFPLVPIPFTGHTAQLEVSSSVLPPEVQRGRELFYSAMAPGIASSNAGIACATCHTDGRSDGVTWQFTDRARQTPSLAGPITP